MTVRKICNIYMSMSQTEIIGHSVTKKYKALLRGEGLFLVPLQLRHIVLKTGIL